MKKRRYLGTSHLFNVGTNHEFRNGLDIELDADSARIEINSLIEPDRRVPVTVTEEEARFARRLILKMEREDYRAKRQAGEFAFFKQKRRKARPQPPACDQCGGYGGNEDEDGNWKECRMCQV